uniref:Uncharacterized protein n=1 Tax=Oryza barthii TaxID=65489 RepID=A0A0D3HEG6_9ORYZ
MGMKKRRRLLGDDDDDLALNEGLYMALECGALTAGHPNADRLIAPGSPYPAAAMHSSAGSSGCLKTHTAMAVMETARRGRGTARLIVTVLSKRRGVKSLLILVSWEIWKERNSRVFQSIETTPCRIIDRATEEIWLWRAGGAKSIQSLMPDDRGRIRCLYYDYMGIRIVHLSKENFCGREMELEKMTCGEDSCNDHDRSFRFDEPINAPLIAISIAIAV